MGYVIASYGITAAVLLLYAVVADQRDDEDEPCVDALCRRWANATGDANNTNTANTTAAAPLVTWQEACRRFVFGGTAKFFGVDAETLEASEQRWRERRRTDSC